MRLCVVTAVLVLCASFLGAVHPVGDSLAMFRDWIAYGVVGVGALALLVRVWRLGGVAVAVGVAAVVHLASFNTLHTPTPVAQADLVVYTKNLAARWGDLDAVANDVAAMEADVVLLQELVAENMDALPTVLPNHPYQHICRFSEWGAMAVASRYPLSETGCTEHRSLAHAVVDAPSGPVWVASVHQVWPYPRDQAALLPDILRAIALSHPRRVVAGDFNMVPWGNSVRQIMQAGGLQRISLLLDTIEVRGVGFPIDHVLTDGNGTTSLRGRLGSDHAGLSARIVWDEE